MVQRRGSGDRVFFIGNSLFLALIFMVMLYPFLYVLAVSLSSPNAVIQNKVFLFPVDFNLTAYRVVADNKGIWTGYANTLLYTVVGTLINLVVTSLMAYALSKKYLWGHKFFSLFVIFTMFFQGGMIPNYLLISNLRMINTIWAIVLPGAVSTWYLMVMRTFFSGLPAELEEAAMVDGCNPLVIFIRIIVPLSKPIFFTMTLFYAVTHWNAYMAPLIYLNDKAKFPLQIIMRQILITGDTNFTNAISYLDDTNLIISDTIKYATIIISILPIVMVYPFIQKHFSKGVMIGSVKG
jgi:putative aldouronate transport system permease protein